MTEARPAFYALAPGGWREYVTLLHPPYTLWHLSYVALGAALAADELPWVRLAALLAAFLLAMGVGAHALDELNGRPLGTEISKQALWALAGTSIAGAVAIGIWASLQWTPWLLAFVAAGLFIVVAYNLELFGGRFHGDGWFAAAWGAFPVLTAYLAVAEELRLEAAAAAAYAYLASRAQRALSTQARTVRRRAASVSGEILLRDGGTEPLTAEILVSPAETALRALAGASVALAIALILLRLG